MEKVHKLVKRLMQAGPEELVHTQTVKIPERAHQELMALADFLGRTKTSLASELLVAAIEDAINALPDEKNEDWCINGEPTSVRDRVRMDADVRFRQVRDQWWLAQDSLIPCSEGGVSVEVELADNKK